MSIPGPHMSKLPVTKEQIERLIVDDLKGFPGCEKALAVVVVPVLAHRATTTWTVSCSIPDARTVTLAIAPCSTSCRIFNAPMICSRDTNRRSHADLSAHGRY
jgi:hypothetical protein